MVSKECKKFVKLMENAYRTLYDRCTRAEAERWIKYGRDNVNLLRKILRERELTIGEQIGMQTAIVQLKSLTARFVKHGAGARSEKVEWCDLDTAFKGRIRTGAVINLRHKDLSEFLDDSGRLICRRLKKMVRGGGTKKKWRPRSLKVNAVLMAKFRVTKNDEIVEETYTFGTRNEILLPTTDIDEWFTHDVKEKLLSKVEDFELKDSGWSLIDITNVTFNMNKYTPLQGGLSTFVPLPKDLQLKRAVVNVQNKDPYCFLWAITAALSPPVKKSERTSSYKHFSELLNYESFSFPMKMCSIPRFEKLNELSINVYTVRRVKGKSKISPIYFSKYKSDRPTIKLLLLETGIDAGGNKDDAVFHFAWIKNFSRLVSSQISRHKCAKWICDRCLCHFQKEDTLNRHKIDCFELNHCRVLLPKEKKDDILQFKDHKNKIDVPFCIYADLECLLEPDQSVSGNNKHIPYSIAYYLHCSYDDSISELKSYRGKDCIEWFMKELHRMAQFINHRLFTIVPMEQLQADQIRAFDAADTCYICEKSFAEGEMKVRDHCHFTGKYRGPAHNSCNLNYKNPNHVPVVFHNLSGYDSHFLIKALATEFPGDVKLLPVNKERFISFTKSVKKTAVKYRFIDSFRFMASSIEKLASYLDAESKTITRAYCDTEEEFSLLSRKGVFPYEYLDGWDKLDDKALPPKATFFSRLNNEEISDEEYAHALNVWRVFKVKSLGEYSDLYLETDVLLLADIFENFRRTCSRTYHLDPLHYYTAPGLAFDAMLKYTDVKLELLTDVDMLLFFEKGIRGGVAQCSNRYARANNPYMGDDFDPSQEVSYLMYYDVNNLYGAAMSQSLPYGSFEWIEDFENLKIETIADDSSTGFVLEVDLEYPRDLHHTHKDFPLCAEHFTPPGGTQSKLIGTLLPKKNYVIHYRNLKQCLALGMQVSKIHRVLQFKQRAWLKSYIDLNTECRKNSSNDFEKKIYKLMNNAVFGKTMENPRKHRSVRLLTKWTGANGARSLIRKPTFHSCTVFGKNLVIIESRKACVRFYKPIYAGFTILDVSKIYMYDFHYNYIRRTFGDNSKLMYTDTDSFIYQFTVPDIYETIKEDIHKFDTSDYPLDNRQGIPRVNKKVLGLMKDENNGKIMTEFAGLRAKLYAYNIMGDVEKKETTKKRAKGVKGSTLKTITFEDYKSCLLYHKNVVKHQYMIRSRKHIVETIRQNKLMLSWNDNKRILSSNSTDTVPWGYKQ